MKPSEEGRYTLYARRRIRLFEDAPTSDKGPNGLYACATSNLSERLMITAKQKNAEQSFEEEDLSTQQTKEIPEGIPLPILEVPYLHVLEGCIKLLYGMPTDPLWTSYPVTDMGKLKMKISKAELEATMKKKRDKQAAAKGGASSQTDKGEERPTSTVVVEPSSLPIAIPSGDSPPSKRLGG
ncbi:hypothetical protein FNV43_RR15072 [Rhamnella rubrinervis]|uniref:Uncharacterized protein n=1 Tax=Rhamnella rubrinervis TaxID=2594499 RepID=A0A8K0GWX0_9ROSA|nr:hypothetical protein FNV43_RR15072 [Rhamnella rubrinervis]